VVAPNEFWLNLHRLSDSYNCEGLSPDERAANIVEQFREMPLIAQRQVLGELLNVLTNLPDLYPLVVAAANESEQTAAKKRGERQFA